MTNYSDEFISAILGRPGRDALHDITRSTAGGAARGAGVLMGLPGDIAEYGARGLDRATKAVGSVFGAEITPRQDQEPRYGSTAAISAIASLLGGAYKPKTMAGEYAETVGSFLPGAVIFPGGVLANALRYGILPGLASEAAGQVTAGSPYELAARIGAGVGTGGTLGALTHTSPNSNLWRRLFVQNIDEVPDAILMANSQSARQ